MKTISRYIMTLALLLTAVTGAWAQEEVLLTTINASSDFTSGSKTFDGVATVTITGNIACDEMSNMCWSAVYGSSGGSVTVEPAEGTTISSCKFYFDNNGTYTISTAPFVLYPIMLNGSSFQIYTGPNFTGEQLYGSEGIKKIEVYAPAEAPLTVEPGSSANTWTFTMPGSDVVLTPIYAKAAAFATTGTEPDVKTLLPEAAEGVIAGTDASLIAEGTGIVAFAGESNEVTQGTLMYAVTPATVTEAPAFDAANKWSADVPTAKTVADGGIDVLVWYYIKGADAPDGQQATEENTFNDTEPACLTVQVLTNKFDIQLNAANANTIEAGKATVTVAGAAATVTDGKLQGVKMGSEVKLEAKPGYKFRKVEVKKKAEGKPLANATTEDLGKVIGADGKIYATKDAAEAVATGNAVAMICYVNEGHGLALALSDISSHYHSWDNSSSYNEGKTAAELCSAWNTSKAVTGARWKLASKSEMNLMINAAGNYAALRDGFSAVGGTNMIDEYYWLSDESTVDYAGNINFSYNDGWSQEFKYDNEKVRACLEW